MKGKNKISIAACSGMSPYGLVSRATSSDTVAETDNTISICMGATSADKDGFRNLIKKYPIIALSGCDGNCTQKILEQKGVKPLKNIIVMDELNKKDLKPTDVSRLDDNGEICVEYMKNKIKKELKEFEI
ncbi:putative zinc-binding protein [Methanobacterium spitsbergense]|uniref:Putative zinc-binding protein n=1 Tax=Methanobacterium spitsbergense TaxID=2874285 RepID=A0A8T5UX00_9EURY|nr:putative zinc-binding protein [Methanobacterium spitsbergense]MBZ2166426.1 putative zinc-binding protein [Methanobacterium spitsbergense]